MQKVAEMMDFYEGEEVPKLLFSTSWKDRE